MCLAPFFVNFAPSKQIRSFRRRCLKLPPPSILRIRFFQAQVWSLETVCQQKHNESVSPYFTEAWEVSYNLRIFDTKSLCYAGVYKTPDKHPVKSVLLQVIAVIFFHGGNKNLFGG